MADAKSSIAQAIIERLSSQVDLGTTLATAVIGGTVALLVQITLFNGSRSNRPIILIRRGWLIAIFGAELFSLLCGYIARGTLTGITPILLQLPDSVWKDKTGAPISFTNVAFDYDMTLAVSIQAQAISLLVGVVAICMFVFANRRRLG